MYLKIGTTLKLNSTSDRDIIQTIQNLTRSRQLGKFIELMFRYVLSSDGSVKEMGEFESSDVKTRQSADSKLMQEMQTIKSQLNELSNIVKKLELDSQVKLILGYEGIVDSTVLTTMAVQKHIKSLEMCMSDGYRHGEYELDRLDDLKKHAVEVAEMIIGDLGKISNSQQRFIGGGETKIKKEEVVTKAETTVSAPVVNAKVIPDVGAVEKRVVSEIVGENQSADMEDLSNSELDDILGFLG